MFIISVQFCIILISWFYQREMCGDTQRSPPPPPSGVQHYLNASTFLLLHSLKHISENFTLKTQNRESRHGIQMTVTIKLLKLIFLEV